ncbi:beta-glucosidase [Hymenobacter fodinae]|uniref:Beta-glucosidase n=1 Tax=Hymenobacter fodinae TaxID=2510796 RepID=A0A4Z0P4T7_9BACT|nr:beta-glucosidase [Hymenobacter fodinae]
MGLGLLVACQQSGNDAPAPQPDPTPPVPAVSDVAADRALLNQVQEASFRYFWDYGHPVSGMARERTGSGETVTSGGTGFGVQAIVVATSRGWITRAEAVTRVAQICSFLARADRFHGAWSHWINGSTGAVIPFSTQDDGGDLVETSLLLNGLLIARTYFNGTDPAETALRQQITQLWESVEWNWYASRGDGQLYWHWSPRYGWAMNLPIRGWNECLITYVLALASPTHPIMPAAYQSTWAAGLNTTPASYEGYPMSMGPAYGGPLFFAHYSFLSLDPRQMQDQYANYWLHNVRHTLINRAWCLYSAPKSYGYYASSWGLTASDDPMGYRAHQPTDDNGTVAPTAALSSMPYTPYYSMLVLRNLYGTSLGAVTGQYGPFDAYNRSRSWIASSFLAIDQGPIVVMLENYRSGLLWQLGRNTPELQTGLRQAGIQAPTYETGFGLSVSEARTNQLDLLRHPDLNIYTIDVTLAAAGTATLELLNAAGAVTETIWNTEAKAAGIHAVRFGTAATTGTYTLRLRTGSLTKELNVVLR